VDKARGCALTSGSQNYGGGSLTSPLSGAPHSGSFRRGLLKVATAIFGGTDSLDNRPPARTRQDQRLFSALLCRPVRQPRRVGLVGKIGALRALGT
jgi:hypothetical protein